LHFTIDFHQSLTATWTQIATTFLPAAGASIVWPINHFAPSKAPARHCFTQQVLQFAWLGSFHLKQLIIK
jgi:hypothetical protein